MTDLIIYKKSGSLIDSLNVNLPLPVTNIEKYEKHKTESDPILSNALTPFSAFQNGLGDAIAAYLKLGNEDKVKNKIISETPPKNEETHIMEFLIKKILKDFNSVKFIKQQDRYLAVHNGKIYQFSLILERTDFNQIELTPQELNKYHQYLNKGILFERPYLNGKRPTEQDFIKSDPEKICRTLSFAEKEAINIYTGSAYSSMNRFLRGDIKGAIEYQDIPILDRKGQISHGIKEVLLHVAVAVSGLNHLPDYIPPLDENGNVSKYLFRGETNLPEEILKKRKWAFLTGGVTTEMGFLSTAYFRPAEGFFDEHSNAGILIKNLKGKKITPLSQLGNSEREILLPPTQMQWLYHKDVITDIYKNTIAFFIAKPITVKPEATIDYVPKKEEPLVSTLEKKNFQII